MSSSIVTAEQFALDLFGFTLSIWETARLLSNEKTRSEGEKKLIRLQERFKSYKQRPFLEDSMRMFLKEDFDPAKYSSLLDEITKKSYQDILPEIKSLVCQTREYVNESKRTSSPISRFF